MHQIDIDNAANVLRAITQYCNSCEGNAVEIYGQNPNGEPKQCIGVCESFGVMEQYYGNSLTECLEKAGIKVEKLNNFNKPNLELL